MLTVEYCSCAWNPSYKKDKELLEKIQHSYTKMIINMREKTWRNKSLGLWTLEERRDRQDIIEVFKMYRGHSSVALQELFEIDTNRKGTRGHSCKLKKVRCSDHIDYTISRYRSQIHPAYDIVAAIYRTISCTNARLTRVLLTHCSGGVCVWLTWRRSPCTPSVAPSVSRSLR